MNAYAELAVTTNFSFLRGAAHPEELVATADELGLAAIGIADRNSFAGVVRAYSEARTRKIKLVVGVRLVTVDGFEVLAYSIDRAAYGRLCRLLSAGNLKAKKGECHLTFEEILAASAGQIFIALPPLNVHRHPEQRAGAKDAAGITNSATADPDRQPANSDRNRIYPISDAPRPASFEARAARGHLRMTEVLFRTSQP